MKPLEKPGAKVDQRHVQKHRRCSDALLQGASQMSTAVPMYSLLYTLSTGKDLAYELLEGASGMLDAQCEYKGKQFNAALNVQVAGYTVKYKGLTYATILGAGHFTPETNPVQSFAMFYRFISNADL
jgi:carboxypeptidase C (cathepsin A)